MLIATLNIERGSKIFLTSYQVGVFWMTLGHVSLENVQIGKDVSAVARDGLTGRDVAHPAVSRSWSVARHSQSVIWSCRQHAVDSRLTAHLTTTTEHTNGRHH